MLRGSVKYEIYIHFRQVGHHLFSIILVLNIELVQMNLTECRSSSCHSSDTVCLFTDLVFYYRNKIITNSLSSIHGLTIVYLRINEAELRILCRCNCRNGISDIWSCSKKAHSVTGVFFSIPSVSWRHNTQCTMTYKAFRMRLVIVFYVFSGSTWMQQGSDPLG